MDAGGREVALVPRGSGHGSPRARCLSLQQREERAEEPAVCSPGTASGTPCGCPCF